MSAMPEEINALVAELERSSGGSGSYQLQEHGGRSYHLGQLWGKPVVLVFSRWGKVAAAATAATLIAKFAASEVLFTGVAGATSENLSLGDIVVGRQLYQHDMDARPFFKQYEIPLLGVSAFDTCAKTRSKLIDAVKCFFADEFHAVKDLAKKSGIALGVPRCIEGDIASGDRFFADSAAILSLKQDLPTVACVEMEGAAVAQVCFEHQTPFSVLRTISDGGDEDAPVNFAQFIETVASAYSLHVIRHYLVSGS